jgi:hypothetical protein
MKPNSEVGNKHHREVATEYSDIAGVSLTSLVNGVIPAGNQVRAAHKLRMYPARLLFVGDLTGSLRGKLLRCRGIDLPVDGLKRELIASPQRKKLSNEVL